MKPLNEIKADAEIIDEETGAKALLEACQYQADDRMDGDLLTIVACHLLNEADEAEAGGLVDLPKSCRDWADKLLKKQVLQAKALKIAEGE